MLSSRRLLVAIALGGLLVAPALVSGATGAIGGGSGLRGTLDPSFGNSGRVLAKPPLDAADSEFVAAAREPDGRVVFTLRRTGLVSGKVTEIEMRSPTGALDPSFGKGGRVAVEGASAVTTMSNGDILVGVTKCGGKESSVELLDPGGAPVASFGKGGCGDGGVPFAVDRIALDPQGRILLAGDVYYCEPCGKDVLPRWEVVLARLLPDGRLDPSFGEAGVVHTREYPRPAPKTYEEWGEVSGLAATADGGLIFSTASALVRLDEHGALAGGFGNQGVAPLPGAANAFVELPDGSTLVTSTETLGKAIQVSKFGPNGTLDPSFGSAGSAALSFPNEATGEAIATTPAGDILVFADERGGPGCAPCTPTPLLTRLTANGQVDPTYGEAGTATLPAPRQGFFATTLWVRSILVAADGSAVLAGRLGDADAIAISRNADGTPNPAFANAGLLLEHFEEPAQLQATGLTVGKGGELIATTKRSNAPGIRSGWLVGFGPDGEQRPGPLGTNAAETLSKGGIVSDGPGRFVTWEPEEPKPVLLATWRDGRRVKGYGHNGTAKLPPKFIPEGLVPVPGGGVAVVGTLAHHAMAVYRLGRSGHPLHGFGHDGLAVAPHTQNESVAYAGLIEPDGDLVLAGYLGGGIGAARFLPHGRLDPAYGHHGLARDLTDGYGTQIAPLGGGVVIANGSRGSAGEVGARLLRLDSQGRLFRGFGQKRLLHGGSEKGPLALFTAGGRIVTVTNPSFEKHHRGVGVELRSYRPDGSVDRSFGHDGELIYGAGKKGKHVLAPAAAVQQPDGKIVVVGTLSVGRQGTQLALVRFR